MATWLITNLISYDSYEGESNVVYAVEYSVSATDSDTTHTLTGRLNLDLKDLSSLTPYSSLASETVLGWVKTGLGSDEVSALEKVVASTVEEKNREGITSGKPW